MHYKKKSEEGREDTRISEYLCLPHPDRFLPLKVMLELQMIHYSKHAQLVVMTPYAIPRKRSPDPLSPEKKHAKKVQEVRLNYFFTQTLRIQQRGKGIQK